MKNGDFWKEKKEYYTEKFTTKQGIAEYLLATPIWAFVIVEWKDQIFGFFMELFSFVGIDFVQLYLAYLGFGVALSVIGLGISFILIKIIKEVIP